MGSGIVPSPSEVMTKATRMLKRIMLLQMVCVLCFVAGGAMVLRTAWENNHLACALHGRQLASEGGCHRELRTPLLSFGGASGVK